MITLNPDSHLFILYVAVGGIHTKSQELSDTLDGATRETKREVTETVADVNEADAGKKLRNKARACGAKYCTTVRNFTVSDGARIKQFLDEVAPLREEIRLHNASAKHHRVEFEFTPVPLAASIGPETAQAIYKEIGQRLDAAKEHVMRGDIASIDAWLKRNRAIGAFLSAGAASLVGDAMDELRASCTALRGAVKEGKDPAQVGADIVNNVGLYALDAARGIVASTTPASNPVSLTGTGA